MDIRLYIQSAKGLPEVVVFKSQLEAISYAKRAIKKNSSETPRKIVWEGRDQTLHYTPVSDWYDTLSVTEAL